MTHKNLTPERVQENTNLLMNNKIKMMQPP